LGSQRSPEGRLPLNTNVRAWAEVVRLVAYAPPVSVDSADFARLGELPKIPRNLLSMGERRSGL